MRVHLEHIWICLPVQDAEAAQEECKATAEARIVAAEQEAAAERERCQRVLSAAANGHLPLLEGPGATYAVCYYRL